MYKTVDWPQIICCLCAARLLPGTAVGAHPPAFLVVGEVAVSREASRTELLAGVGVLIGLPKT